MLCLRRPLVAPAHDGAFAVSGGERALRLQVSAAQQYDEHGGKYSDIERVVSFYRDDVEIPFLFFSVLGSVHGKRVLNVGCGGGSTRAWSSYAKRDAGAPSASKKGMGFMSWYGTRRACDASGVLSPRIIGVPPLILVACFGKTRAPCNPSIRDVGALLSS